MHTVLQLYKDLSIINLPHELPTHEIDIHLDTQPIVLTAVENKHLQKIKQMSHTFPINQEPVQLELNGSPFKSPAHFLNRWKQDHLTQLNK